MDKWKYAQDFFHPGIHLLLTSLSLLTCILIIRSLGLSLIVGPNLDLQP